jgi:KDO2-lipid IV(A) lauroyltransferase
VAKRKKKSDFANRCEYAALRVACAAVNALPYAMACAFARGAAFLAFDVLRIKRARTLERIMGAFPKMSAREAARVGRASLANVFLNAIEMIRARRFDRAWIDSHVADMPEYAGRLRALVDEGKGVVIMVPHSGNWYMAAWAMAAWGIPLFAIAARQRNPYVNAWMERLYGSIDVLERGAASTLREILQRIRRGQSFAILPDLRAPQPDVQVPFLGGTANVSHAGALFAVQTGAPVAVAVMRRIKGKHVFDHLATLRPDPDAKDKKEEARRITREVFALLDAAIRKTPEQWFWFNKRWILQPVDNRPPRAP